MKKVIYTLLLSAAMAVTVNAADPIHVKLYPAGPPSSNGLENTPETITDKGYYTNVSDPELMVYLPDETLATGQAMLVVPGGSYKNVCTPREGDKTAQWLNSEGITAMVLKYRMPNGHPDIPLEDGIQAMRIIRDNAAQWHINPDNVGVIGFSAGGHFVSNLITRCPDTTLTPHFAVLVYPVISMDYSNAHTRENLLGDKQSDIKARNYYSTETHVSARTPETMIVLADNDNLVLPDNSIRFYRALKRNNVKAEMHIFPDGKHGFWMKDRYRHASDTYPLVMRWIKKHDRTNKTK